MSARMLLPRAGAPAASAAVRRAALMTARSYATAPAAAPVAKVSVLDNGLTVATEANPAAKTATVGAWIGAGSRTDAPADAGLANLYRLVSQKGPSAEVAKLGYSLTGETSREYTSFSAQTLAEDVPKAVSALADLLQQPDLSDAAFAGERDAVLAAIEADKPAKDLVFEYLYAVAFQKQALGQTVAGDEAAVQALLPGQLKLFHQKYVVSDNTTLVGTGAVDHDALVAAAQQLFTALPPSADPLLLPKPTRTQFVGSDVRIRDDAYPTCHFAIAVEGASATSPDAVPLLVLQGIMGNWERSLGASTLLSSRLSSKVAENELAISYTHFSHNFSDTGLWGVYVESDGVDRLDDTAHFILKEWQRMSIAPTEVETERAKAQLKVALALSQSAPGGLAASIGQQLSSTGTRLTLEDLSAQIDAVTPAVIKATASKYLWDRDIAIAAFGRTEGLFTYDRIRADMSSMLY